MKKPPLFFIIFAILTNISFAQTSTGRSDNCSEISLSPDTLTIGKVVRNTDVIKSVTIKNTGKCPLIISSVTGGLPREYTCSKNYYQPGDSGVLLIIYPTDKVGPVSQVLTINSNAKNPSLLFYIKGEIVPEKICGQLAFDKDTIDLGPIPYVIGKHFTINVYNKGKCPMSFHTQAVMDDYLSVLSFPYYPINTNDTGKIEIHLGGKLTGAYTGKLTIVSTNSSPESTTVFLKARFLPAH